MSITGASRKQAGLFYDKGGEVYNVLHPDFGATGLYVDDTAAINAAATAASAAGGGELYIPKGGYIINPTTVVVIGGNNYSVGLNIPSNVTLRGAGKTATIFKAIAAFAANGKMVLLNGVSGVTIKDIGFDGNITNQTLVTTLDNGFTAIACHNNCSDIEVASCRFTGFTQDCIFAGYPNGTAVDGLDVHHCVFSDFQRGGVTVVSAINVHIHHNKFASSTRGLGSVAHGSNGVWLEPNVVTDPLEEIVIDHNTFRNLNGGVWLYNANQTDLFDVAVDTNIFVSCDTGVYGLSAWFVGITNNKFRFCGLHATASFDKPVYLSGSRWASITGNGFRDCGSEKGDIELAGANYYALIDDNTFRGSKRDCIHVELAASQYGMPTVTNNRGELCGVGTVNTYFGIYMKCPGGTPGEDGTVTDNTFATSTTTGLAAAIKSENWQAGILEDNFYSGTGVPLVIVGAFAPGYAAVVWDPPSIAAGAQATTTVTVAGANFTDASSYSVIPPYTLGGLHVVAYCSAVNTVTIVLVNNTAGAIDLGSGTWGVKMRRRY